MPSDNNGNIIPISQVRRTFEKPSGHRRVDTLLSVDDPAAAIAALSVPDLHQLVHETGFADSEDLIRFASPTQIRGCLDIDGWRADRLDETGLMPWLASLVTAGFEHLGAVWRTLDPELVALILARHTVVYNLVDEEEPDDSDGKPIFTTPDSFFAIKLVDDSDDTARLIHQIIDDLYRADMALAQHTIMAGATEPESHLEESSYHFRSGRMADLGYVEFYEALEVYRPLDPKSVTIGEGTEDRIPQTAADDSAQHPGGLTPAIAEQVLKRSFLADVLDRVGNADALANLEALIVLLVNKVLAAAKLPPGDVDGIRVGAEHATATLSLGLELVCHGEVSRGPDALSTISLSRLHRAGYSATLPLFHMAKNLAPKAAAAGPRAEAMLSSLLRARPFFPRELDGGDTPGVGPRPFESRDDLAKIGAELAELGVRIAIAEGLGVDLIAHAVRGDVRDASDKHSAANSDSARFQNFVELDDWIRTAMAHAMLGNTTNAVEPESSRLSPLSRADLLRLRTTAFLDDTLNKTAREQAAAAVLHAIDTDQFASMRAILLRLLTSWNSDIETALAPLSAEMSEQNIDLRYISGLRTEP